MTAMLPSPFLDSAVTPAADEAVASSPLISISDATANNSWEDRMWLVLAEVLALPPIDLDERPLFLRTSL